MSWEAGTDPLDRRFVVTDVARGEQSGVVSLAWAGAPLGLEFDSVRLVEVPAVDTFKVTRVVVEQAGRQLIRVHFSDVLDRNQDVDGLVRLAGNAEATVSVSNNVVSLSPTERLTGDINVVVDAAVRSLGGRSVGRDRRFGVSLRDYTPAVEMIGDGVIVPSSRGMTLPFRAVALAAVEVSVTRVFTNNVGQFFQENELDGRYSLRRVGRTVFRGEIPLRGAAAVDLLDWNTYALDLAKIVTVEPGAIYRVSIDFAERHARYPCGDDTQDAAPSASEPIAAGQLPYEVRFANYDQRDDYYLDDEDEYAYYDYDESADATDPCDPAYYRNRAQRRNFLASDIGLIAKSSGAGEMIVVATDLRTAQPISGLDVELVDEQLQVKAFAKTGGNGVATFADARHVLMVTAKRGEERGYLKVADYTALNTSTFDVGGEYVADGVRGYLYGERGVWRPGDSIYLTLILDREARALAAGGDANVYFTLKDPAGATLVERAVRPSAPDFYDLRTATAPDAPTGAYRAVVRVGASQLCRSVVRVETVMPNRLKVEFGFAGGTVDVTDDTQISLMARWLFGGAAGPLKADVEYSARGTQPSFIDGKATARYKDFNFLDEARPYEVSEEKLFDGNLDAEGTARFAVPVARAGGELPPGMLQARLVTRVFEPTGAFSTVTRSVTLSPFESYVGVKTPESESWYGLDGSQPIPFELVTLDARGRPVPRQVTVEVYDIAWSYWWERSEQRDLASYVANSGASRTMSTTVDIPNGRTTWRADLSKLEFGRKLVRVTDPTSGHATSTVITIENPRWAYDASTRPGGAELLAFKLDKSDYLAGETAKVSLPAFANGRAFVTVERGDRILSYRWVDGLATPQDLEIDIDEAMVPNAFVHVTLLQPHAQTVNDQPIRLFGIQPMTVSSPELRLSPKLAVASASHPKGMELSPEEAFTVSVSEADGKPMSYTLAVVEEGLLDLTSFSTPDPYARFNQRLALGVRTWDLYKYVLGAFDGKLAGLLAVGGDAATGEKVDPRANRFRPVVKFLGPFSLPSGKTARHELMMPNYMGAVRVMVVAGRDGAYGSAELTRPVRRPLMVMATLPRVVSPGETIDLPVTVFATDAKIRNVSVELDRLKLLEPESRTGQATFARPGEQIVRFRLRVPEQLGVANVRVRVSGAGFSASDEIELDVRAPNPRTSDVQAAVIEPGETWSGTYAAVGIAGTNEGSLEFSGNLPLKLEQRLDYLIGYPHGCLEQVISKGFPQLYLAKLMDLPAARAARTQASVEATLAALPKYRRGDGSFSYWPGQPYLSNWNTNYAGHFMLEAKAAGYRVEPSLLSGWTGYQKRAANEWTQTLANAREDDSALIQAYRLMTLALAGEPQLGAMNRLRGQAGLNQPTTQLLAAAYALAGQTDAARQVLAKAENAPEPTRDFAYSAYTYGSPIRDQAIALYVFNLLKDRTAAFRTAQAISRGMSSDQWYSTQSTAWSLLAMSKYLDVKADAGPLSYTFALASAPAKAATQEKELRVVPLPGPTAAGQQVRITNTGTRRLMVNLVSTGIAVAGAEAPPASDNLLMDVRYTSLNGERLDPANVQQGTDFLAVVTVRHPGRLGAYHDLALTQLFPAGWEIRNRRLEGGAAAPSGVQYQDIRDDRVLSYFDLGVGKQVVVTTQLNAAYTGDYNLPQVYVQAMYDRGVSARSRGGRVEVRGVVVE